MDDPKCLHCGKDLAAYDVAANDDAEPIGIFCGKEIVDYSPEAVAKA